MIRPLFAVVSSMAFLMLASAPVCAQWTKVPAAKVPRTPDGKPNLSAPAPRLPDGRPDLQGTWERTDPKYGRDLAADMKPEDVPFQPWAKAVANERADGSHEAENPDANCLPQGIPRIGAVPPPWKIFQTPTVVVILYEAFNLWRQVFLDGRELLSAEEVNPTWMGYSTGKWDGDTLVVDTRGFNGKTWLDQLGKPTTDALHVTERFRRKDFGHLEIRITIDDPKAYTKPWTITQEARLVPNMELMEMICNENNRDLQHLPGKK